MPSMPSYSSWRQRYSTTTHELDICSHVLDGLHLDHDQLVDLGSGDADGSPTSGYLFS